MEMFQRWPHKLDCPSVPDEQLKQIAGAFYCPLCSRKVGFVTLEEFESQLIEFIATHTR